MPRQANPECPPTTPHVNEPLTQGASMRVVSRVCLISALTLVLSQLAVSAGAEPTVVRPGQAGARLAGAEEGPPVRGAEKESLTTIAKGKQFESVLGVEVRTRIEEGMGRIIDLLADRSGEVQAAVIEFGGFMGIGTRKIAVEWSALRFEVEGKQPIVILDMTRDQLRVAPEYKPHEPAVVRRVAD
jgi:PRC-barrel domain